MNYRLLGKSLLKISEVSFGCMSLPVNQPSVAQQLIHKAIDYGVNFFDTADLYDKGENEKIVGEALKGKRDQIVLATKVGNQWRADGSGWDWNPKKEYILKAIDRSLKRLQTDYIDLYQLHGGTIEDPMDETIEAFEILKEKGKIRFYGVSSIRPNVIQEYVNRSNITSVMMQYSLLDRRPEEACLSLLKENGIGVLARGVLAKGLLAGKPVKEYLDLSAEEVRYIIDILQQMISPTTKTANAAIQFVLDNDAITSAVLGVRTEKQLKECFAEEYQEAINQKEILWLKQKIVSKIYKDHR